ncbi:MAG: hypothetical protein GY861_27305, partial [bacterium]|nr:hypothetical protein [bacterium]
VNIAGVISPSLTTFTASPTSIPTSGSQTSTPTTLRVIPKDTNGNEVGSGLSVSFIKVSGPSYYVSNSVTYNEEDKSYSQQWNATEFGTLVIKAKINRTNLDSTVSVEVYLEAVSSTLTTVTADPQTIFTSTESTSAISTITIHAYDIEGNAYRSELPVLLETTKGTLLDSVEYQGGNQYTQELKSSSDPGTAV